MPAYPEEPRLRRPTIPMRPRRGAAYPEAAEDGYPEVADEDAAYPERRSSPADAAIPRPPIPDVAVPHTPADAAHPDAAYPAAAPEASMRMSRIPTSQFRTPLRMSRSGCRHARRRAEVRAARSRRYRRRTGRQAASGGTGPGRASDNPPAVGRPVSDARRISDQGQRRFGLYYTPDSELYHDTLAEIWFVQRRSRASQRLHQGRLTRDFSRRKPSGAISCGSP